MGKKGRKTRWRRLPMTGPEAASDAVSSSAQGFRGGSADSEQGSNDAPSRLTFNEDEYTKITTPRQDVLFKKGYLGRRRTQNPTETPEAQSTADSVESSEYLAEEQPQYFAPPGGFIDQNGVFYVNGGTYEFYDPYTGNVTVVVGPSAPYPPQAPLLSAMPCQPVPLAPLEWYNPPPGSYMCPSAYPNTPSRNKRNSTDSQNCSAQSSESTGPPGSPQEPTDMMEMGGAGGGPPMFPPQPPHYMYPGFMFGAPIYPMNGVNVQGVMPQCSPVPPPPPDVCPTSVVAKRRKKRRRKRRGGATDEGSESSCEEVISCDNAACSQSGASSDAGGQGSSCSKTNSDSGINTEPTPDSGSNTPPLPCEDDHLHSPCESLPDQQNDKESSCTSTPEAQKRTFESLPASDAEETLQELSCSSEPPQLAGCPPELAAIDNMAAAGEHVISVTSSSSSATFEAKTVFDSTTVTSQSSVADDCLPQTLEPEIVAVTQITLEETALVHLPAVQESQQDVVHLPGVMCQQENVLIPRVVPCQPDNAHMSGEVSEEEVIADVTDYDVNDNNKESRTDLVHNDKEIEDRIDVEIVVVEQDPETNEESLEVVEEVEHMEETTTKVFGEEEEVSYEDRIEVVVEESCDVNEKEGYDAEEISEPISLIEDNILMNFDMVCPMVSEEQLKQIESEFDSCLSRFLKIQESLPPKPPPRRKRALNRVAEKVASKVVDAAIEEAVAEAANKKSAATVCNQRLPITEAVTKWLQSQGGTVLSVSTASSTDEDSDEVDEGIEDGESSTNQKNVEGNPFLAPYLSGSRTRVADADDCVSLVSSAGEWDMYQEHQERTRAICDPATSVDKYYRLGADDPDASASIASPPIIKTAVHIRRAGPFPCGVCCIIQ
ncbi:uncharacterized protein LOC111051386 [Nilaparvata lugens]|uniref:uncharacterized protein LOC111051386 n=1 Tax=Nilaparvata lugens TaxID=108931 RepID=UPI00193D9EC6|nr:uncharacterized protein LOC111051386 [Nilaparvata lugens]